MAERTVYYRKSDTLQATNDAVNWTPLVSANWAPEPNTDYFIMYNVQEIYSTSTSVNTRYRFIDINTANSISTPTIRQGNINDILSLGAIFKFTSNNNPGVQLMNVEMQPFTAAATTSAKESSILIVKAMFEDVCSESMGQSSTTDNSFSLKNSIVWTPNTEGYYLIISSAEVAGVEPSSNRPTTRVRLNINNEELIQFDSFKGYPTTTLSQWAPWVAMSILYCNTNQQNVAVEYCTSSEANSASIRKSSIVAMRTDSFAEFNSNQNNNRQTSSSTSPVNMANITYRSQSRQHIILSTGLLDYSTSSVPGEVTANVSNNRLAHNILRAGGSGGGSDTGGTRVAFINMNYVDNVTANINSFETQAWCNTSSRTVGFTNAFIADIIASNFIPGVSYG